MKYLGVYTDDKLTVLGQTKLPTTENDLAQCLNIYRFRHYLSERALQPYILASSTVICNMQLEFGVELGRRSFDG